MLAGWRGQWRALATPARWAGGREFKSRRSDRHLAQPPGGPSKLADAWGDCRKGYLPRPSVNYDCCSALLASERAMQIRSACFRSTSRETSPSPVIRGLTWISWALLVWRSLSLELSRLFFRRQFYSTAFRIR